MDGPEFTKMHGLGNDFVIIDARRRKVSLGTDQVRAIAHRRAGIGCDQLIVIEQPTDSDTDAFFTIHNSDGGEVDACGNATRCVAWMVMEEAGADRARLATKAGPLIATRAGENMIAVDMGRPALEWKRIPLAREQDTLHLDLARGPLSDPVAVSMGNPHAVFFVDDVEAVEIETLGPALETDPLFPERANIGIAEVRGADSMRLRVWERGAGLTMACGTGACAALVAAHRRGLTGRRAEIAVDGGTLRIEWREDDHVVMTGPIAVSFHGLIDGSLLQ